MNKQIINRIKTKVNNIYYPIRKFNKFVVVPLAWFTLYALVQLLCYSKNIFVFFIGIFITWFMLAYEIEHPRVKMIKFANHKWPYKLNLCLLGLMLLGLAIIYSFNSHNLTPSANQQVVTQLIQKNSLMIIEVVCVAPVFEENIFRRCLISFNTKIQLIVSTLISCFVFALAHLWGSPISQPLYFLEYSLLGLGLASSYVLTRNIKYSIMLHMTYNFIACLPMILMMN